MRTEINHWKEVNTCIGGQHIQQILQLKFKKSVSDTSIIYSSCSSQHYNLCFRSGSTKSRNRTEARLEDWAYSVSEVFFKVWNILLFFRHSLEFALHVVKTSWNLFIINFLVKLCIPGAGSKWSPMRTWIRIPIIMFSDGIHNTAHLLRRCVSRGGVAEKCAGHTHNHQQEEGYHRPSPFWYKKIPLEVSPAFFERET